MPGTLRAQMLDAEIELGSHPLGNQLPVARLRVALHAQQRGGAVGGQ
ncbi:MAG: hypothetical protein QOJ29_4569 [Thermoleophilaceae bacterium]|nr:hypothetical protein [Thermoleophilaceae bacterium]